jgi:hypothetical protein
LQSFDFGQYRFCGGGPSERLGVLVVMLDELVDLAFQIRHRVEGTATDRLIDDQCEPAFSTWLSKFQGYSFDRTQLAKLHMDITRAAMILIDAL